MAIKVPASKETETDEAMNGLRVGDHFTEMFTYHVFVVSIEPDGKILTLEGNGPVTFPREGKCWVYQSAQAFRDKFAYGGKTPGYWVRLHRRGENVKGWREIAIINGLSQLSSS